METQVIPVALFYKMIIGLLVTGMGALIMWPFRRGKAEWNSLKESIAQAKHELTEQRTNCLATLQTQGAQQIDLLTKAVNTLDGVRLDLREQTGYLMATAAVAPRKRRASRKIS